MSERSTPERDLSSYVDEAGQIMVGVEIGKHRTGDIRNKITGSMAEPDVVAAFLRELADDVERLADHG